MNRDKSRAENFNKVDRAVSAAINTLESEARDNHAQGRTDAVEKEIAYSRLKDAQLHAREVSMSWDSEARQMIREARDVLRDHYSKPENVNKSRHDIEHCDTALSDIDRQTGGVRSRMADYVDRLKAARPDRKPTLSRGLDQGRERER